MLKWTVGDALQRLAQDKTDFARLIEKEIFDVSLYKPEKTDPQTPHTRRALCDRKRFGQIRLRG